MKEKYDLANTKFSPIYIFFKFAPRDRLIRIQQDGQIYMKNLQYFIDLERKTKEKGKGDISESRLFQATEVKIYDNQTNNLIMKAKTTEFSDSNELRKPVFCITAINIFENICSFEYPRFSSKINIDKRMVSTFTPLEEPYALVINNIEEFLSRIKKALCDIGVPYKYGLVKYRDTRYLHKVEDMVEFNSTFNKELYFEYQKEFRIIIDQLVDDHFEFFIGNISDISAIVPATQVINGMDVEGNVGEPILISN